MKSLSIEQIELLKKYEPLFKTAINSKYLRAQPTVHYKELGDVCKYLGIHFNMSCPVCVLNAVTLVGLLYNKAKAELEVQSIRASETSAQADSSVLSDSSEEPIKSDELPKSEEPIKSEHPKSETNSKAPLVKSGNAKTKSNKTNKKK